MSTSGQITWNKLAKTSGILILVSLIVNIIIYLIAKSFGVFDGFTILGNSYSFVNVIIVTLVLLLITMPSFGYLAINKGMPLEKIRSIAVIVLILTFSMPFLVPATTSILISLEIMHIVTGIIVIFGLTSSYFWK